MARSQPSRKPLDRRRIAEVALQQIDAGGLEELSMRRLGAALGVEGMALYHHFGSKGELLDAVLDLLLEEMALPQDETPPLARLRRTFESLRQIALRHPQAFLLIPTRRFRTDAQLDFYEKLLGIFREAGFTPARAATFFRVLAAFVTGASMAEIGSRAQQPHATPIRLEDFNDPERYPLVSAVVPHLRVGKLQGIFDFGMDLIFAAINAELGAVAPARKARPRGGTA